MPNGKMALKKSFANCVFSDAGVGQGWVNE